MLYSEHVSVSKKGVVFKDKMGRELSMGHALKKGTNRFYNYYLDFELWMLSWISLIPIHTVRIIAYKLAGVKIGRKAHVHIGANFYDPSGIEIGEGSIVGRNIFLDGRDKLKIGSHVDIASDVMIYNSEHDLETEDFAAIVAPVEIGDYVFIGPRAIILPGIKIGKGAVVAAGAVVTKDVNDFEIVGGIPAKAIGERKNKTLSYKLGRARLFQ
jgi:acetyltransferase-like isoleucine patch superfamily enzyme